MTHPMSVCCRVLPAALFGWRLNICSLLRSSFFLGKVMNLSLYFMVMMLNSDVNRLCLVFYVFHSTFL